MGFKLSYKPFGERAILIEWPQVIDEAILKDVLNLKHKLKEINIKSLVDIISAYNSLLIVYNEFYKGFNEEIQIIDKIYDSDNSSEKTDAFLWKIPVCYDVSFGIDLEMISKEKNRTKAQLIHLYRHKKQERKSKKNQYPSPLLPLRFAPRLSFFLVLR